VSDEAKVRELLAPMDQIPVDMEGRRYRVDRGRAVSSILNAPAIFKERAARARRVQLLSIAAGFAVFVGALGLWSSRKSAPPVVGDFEIIDVRGDVQQKDGELATAGGAEASVRARDGLVVRLFENGRMKLAELRPSGEGRALHFARGAIECRVPKLPPGQHFSVITPDATVVVHGTTFRVVVSDVGAALRTCVSVSEGVVTVNDGTSETRVEALQSWGCAPPKEGSITPSPSSPGPTPKTQDPPPSAEGQRPSRGTLKEENRLFQAGLAAEQKGDARKAAASFSLLLSRYPQSPLAADARTALDRVSKVAP
jgi:hypothetical protein